MDSFIHYSSNTNRGYESGPSELDEKVSLLGKINGELCDQVEVFDDASLKADTALVKESTISPSGTESTVLPPDDDAKPEERIPPGSHNEERARMSGAWDMIPDSDSPLPDIPLGKDWWEMYWPRDHGDSGIGSMSSARSEYQAEVGLGALLSASSVTSSRTQLPDNRGDQQRSDAIKQTLGTGSMSVGLGVVSAVMEAYKGVIAA